MELNGHEIAMRAKCQKLDLVEAETQRTAGRGGEGFDDAVDLADGERLGRVPAVVERHRRGRHLVGFQGFSPGLQRSRRLATAAPVEVPA